MKRILVAALVVLLFAGALVAARLATIEQHLDLEITFQPPGPSRSTALVDGKELAPETTGWRLRFGDRVTDDAPLTIGMADLVDAGAWGEGFPPDDGETRELLGAAFGYEGRLLPGEHDTWTPLADADGLAWLRRVHFLHDGDLLDPMVVLLVRNPAADRAHLGILRLSRDEPVDITGWSGSGATRSESDWLAILRTGVRDRKLSWKFVLNASGSLVSQAGLDGQSLLEEVGAKGWWTGD